MQPLFSCEIRLIVLYFTGKQSAQDLPGASPAAVNRGIWV